VTSDGRPRPAVSRSTEAAIAMHAAVGCHDRRRCRDHHGSGLPVQHGPRHGADAVRPHRKNLTSARSARRWSAGFVSRGSRWQPFRPGSTRYMQEPTSRGAMTRGSRWRSAGSSRHAPRAGARPRGLSSRYRVTGARGPWPSRR